MIKVLFLVPNLGGGGAERVLVNLVNNMDRSKFDVTVQTIFYGGVNVERMHSDIKYICSNKRTFKGMSRVYAFLPAKLLYKNIIGKERYDVIVAYMHGIATKVLCGAPKGIKKIAWLHTSNMQKMSLFKCFPTKKIAIKEVAKCDAIVGVSKTVTDRFAAHTGIKERMYTCYNTNETDVIEALSKEPCVMPADKRPVLCSVGRFTSEKGFSRLIDISYRLQTEGVKHSLILIGDGALREKLEKQVKDLEYKDVYFLGFQKNPYSYLAKSDLFVCSSYFEGFSTATTEAVVLGVPGISTDVSGAKEILTAETQGMVVDNNDEDLYNGIKQMIEKIARGEIDKEKIKSNAERFGVKGSVEKVEELLTFVVEG